MTDKDQPMVTESDTGDPDTAKSEDTVNYGKTSLLENVYLLIFSPSAQSKSPRLRLGLEERKGRRADG
jgi:hypothetical protein